MSYQIYEYMHGVVKEDSVCVAKKNLLSDKSSLTGVGYILSSKYKINEKIKFIQ